MPHKASSPHTLDLFEVMLTIPMPASEPAIAPAKPPALAGLSDDELAEQLGQLVTELRRRMGTGRKSRPELKAAVRDACSSLERLSPLFSKQRGRFAQSSRTSSVLQEGQRKAVQAALLAGVAPSQVAKNFGLPLAAVRKVLEEAA